MPSIISTAIGASGSSKSLPSLGDQVILLEEQNSLLKKQMTVLAVEVNLILDWVARAFGSSVVNANSIYYKDIHQESLEVERIKQSLQPERWTEPEHQNGVQNVQVQEFGNDNEAPSDQLDQLERTSFQHQLQHQNENQPTAAGLSDAVVDNAVTGTEDTEANPSGELVPVDEVEGGAGMDNNEHEEHPPEDEASATISAVPTGVSDNGDEPREPLVHIFSISSSGLVRTGSGVSPKSERKGGRPTGPEPRIPRVATTSSANSNLRKAEEDKARRLRIIQIATNAATRCSTPVRLTETQTTRANTLRSQSAGRGRGHGQSRRARSRRALNVSKRPEIVYRCRHCDSTFFNENVKDAHERNHSAPIVPTAKPEKPAKRYKCPYCPRMFNYSVSLISHEKSHTGEKSFSCEYCHNTFKTQSQLSMHLRTHVKERPYPCRDCDRSFFTQKAMTVHSRVHR